MDYQHKIATWLAKEYDAVFVEGLDVNYPTLLRSGSKDPLAR
jgi:hypothetical protein